MGSGTSVSTSGNGETLTCGGNSVFLNGNETATCSASNALSVSGSSNVIASVTSGSASFSGGGEYISMATGTTATISATTADTVTCNGESATISGGSATATCSATSLAVSGSGGTITATTANVIISESNATINVAAGANVTITGNNDQVIFANGATAMLAGQGDNVTLGSNDFLSLAGMPSNGSWALTADSCNVCGSGTGNTINCGAGIGDIGLNVNNATVNTTLYNGLGDGIKLTGSYDHLNMSGGTVIVNGVGDTASLTCGGGFSTNSIIAADGISMSISNANAGTSVASLFGSHDTFALGTNIGTTIDGSDQTVNTAAGDFLRVNSGLSDLFNGTTSSNRIDLMSNVSATVNGSGSTISLAGTGSSITANAANINLLVAGAGANSNQLDDFIIGSHDVFSDSGLVSGGLTIEGQYDSGFFSGITAQLDGSNLGDTFTDPNGIYFDNLNPSTWDFGSNNFDPFSGTWDPIIVCVPRTTPCADDGAVLRRLRDDGGRHGDVRHGGGAGRGSMPVVRQQLGEVAVLQRG
jgi:hypothetical protein